MTLGFTVCIPTENSCSIKISIKTFRWQPMFTIKKCMCYNIWFGWRMIQIYLTNRIAKYTWARYHGVRTILLQCVFPDKLGKWAHLNGTCIWHGIMILYSKQYPSRHTRVSVSTSNHVRGNVKFWTFVKLHVWVTLNGVSLSLVTMSVSLYGLYDQYHFFQWDFH